VKEMSRETILPEKQRASVALAVLRRTEKQACYECKELLVAFFSPS
jgi:hypothetical protein